MNAANGALQMRGGVALQLRRAGGEVIQFECDAHVRSHGPVETGHCAFTPAGVLNSDYIIHSVGPVYNPNAPIEPQEQLLFNAVYNTLHFANQLQCATLLMPAISTGIFKFPAARAAAVFFDAIM